jgi:hypothetical protein
MRCPSAGSYSLNHNMLVGGTIELVPWP